MPGLHLRLDINMAEHAVRKSAAEPECIDDVLERFLDRQHRIRRARHRVVAQQHVADREGPAVKHLPANILRVVGWGIGLNPGAHIAPGANLAAGERVEYLAPDHNKLVVAHQFDDAGNHIAAQAAHDALDLRFACREQEILQPLQRPVTGPGLGSAVQVSGQEPVERVGIERLRVQIANHRIGKQRARPGSRARVRRGHPDNFVAFLESVRRADQLPVQGGVETPLYPPDIGEQILTGRNISDTHAHGRNRLFGTAGEKRKLNQQG